MITDDIWDEIFGEDFKNLNKRIEKMFSEMDNLDEPGIKTYGYMMYQGPDGVPHFQEFGNAKEKYKLEANIREPFSDVSSDDGKIRATLEIPGVQKEDIVLECTENSLSVKADNARKTFSKTLALPCKVDTKSARATYNNGILEVIFDACGNDSLKQKISID